MSANRTSTTFRYSRAEVAEQILNHINGRSPDGGGLADVYHQFVTERVAEAGYSLSPCMERLHRRQMNAHNCRKPAGLMLNDIELVIDQDGKFPYRWSIDRQVIRSYGLDEETYQLSEEALREKKWKSLIESYHWFARKHPDGQLNIDALVPEVAKILLASELSPPSDTPVSDFDALQQDVEKRIRNIRRQ